MIRNHTSSIPQFNSASPHVFSASPPPHLQRLQCLQHAGPAGDQVLDNEALLAGLVSALDRLLGAVVLHLLRSEAKRPKRCVCACDFMFYSAFVQLCATVD